MLASLACVGGAAHAYHSGQHARAWWLLGGAVVLATAAQMGWRLPAHDRSRTIAALGRVRPTRGRIIVGLSLTLLGAAVWAWGTWSFYGSWAVNFDRGWLSWVVGTVLLGLGLDRCWSRPSRGAERSMHWGWEVAVLAMLMGIAAACRLGNVVEFPGEGSISQVEELQTGNFGKAILMGDRTRWEFLTHAWLAAIGLHFGPPTLWAVRVPFGVLSVLKLIPFYLWVRTVAGPVGALAATTLLACSGWETVLARVMANPQTWAITVAFALLAGPVRRGRPSSYAWLGLVGGYILYDYIAYRPLTPFIVTGVILLSLGDRSVGWGIRLLRPLLTVVLIACMVTPLFFNRLEGKIRHEYLDGWNRARATSGYYEASDSWQTTIEKRLARSRQVVGLFFFSGDSSPHRNIEGRPLIDPVTAALLIVGFGYCLAHAFSPIFGLTAAGFAITVAGTAIFTGNLDVVRIGTALPYTYALAGYGAAGLVAVLRRAGGRVGGTLASAGLAVAVLAGVYDNVAFLFRYWNSPAIRRAYRNNLPYLTSWLARHVRDDEQAIGAAPGYSHVLIPNDGYWMLGDRVRGVVTEGVDGALREWAERPGPVLLFAFAGPGTAAIKEYLEWFLPEVRFEVDLDPLDRQGEVAYAHVSAAPPDLAARLARGLCPGVRGEYELIDRTGATIARLTAMSPLLDYGTWPSVVWQTVGRVEDRLARVRVRMHGAFEVETRGSYQFTPELYGGQAQVVVDRQIGGPRGAIMLEAGRHEIEVTGLFEPRSREALLRLLWRGPDTRGKPEVLPFYRLAPPEGPCVPTAVDFIEDRRA
jgi:hypothetical protein